VYLISEFSSCSASPFLGDRIADGQLLKSRVFKKLSARIPPNVDRHFFRRGKGLATIQRTASFIEPMECLPVERIPEGDLWAYEFKLDGYRAIGVRTEAG
jgi:ATP-dependent DNA ligase